ALVSMTGSATIGHPCSASREGEKPLHRKPVSRDDPLWRAVMTVSTVRVRTFPPSTHRAPPRIEYRRSSCLLFPAAQHPRPTHTHPDEAPLAAPEGGGYCVPPQHGEPVTHAFPTAPQRRFHEPRARRTVSRFGPSAQPQCPRREATSVRTGRTNTCWRREVGTPFESRPRRRLARSGCHPGGR